MQIQLDPNIPTNLTPQDMRNFKTFLDHALDALTAAAGSQIFTLGNQMLVGLALIVLVLNGAKIAFGGNIQPWELMRVVIGIWIPWVMLQFYTTTIPGMIHTFPGMIAGGGGGTGLTPSSLTTLFPPFKKNSQGFSTRLPRLKTPPSR